MHLGVEGLEGGDRDVRGGARLGRGLELGQEDLTLLGQSPGVVDKRGRTIDLPTHEGDVRQDREPEGVVHSVGCVVRALAHCVEVIGQLLATVRRGQQVRIVGDGSSSALGGQQIRARVAQRSPRAPDEDEEQENGCHRSADDADSHRGATPSGVPSLHRCRPRPTVAVTNALVVLSPVGDAMAVLVEPPRSAVLVLGHRSDWLARRACGVGTVVLAPATTSP